jgi:hypothetical protein
MPDRVPQGLGLLGPVDDIDAMAANVVNLWREGPAAMSLAARAHVEQNFSWNATFGRLFGEIYPKAMAHAAARTKGKARQYAGFGQLENAGISKAG